MPHYRFPIWKVSGLVLALSASVPALAADDLLKMANEKLLGLNQPPAMDARNKYADVFCNNLSRHGAKLGYEKACSDYLKYVSAKPDGGKVAKNPAGGIALRVAMIGGIFSDCVRNRITMFSSAQEFMRSTMLDGISSIRFEDIKVSGYSSSIENAKLISSALGKMEMMEGEKLVVVSYSKGSSDLIETLTRFPHTASKIDAVLSVAGVVRGSPLASNKGVFEKILKLSKLDCRGPDGDGLRSITPEVREPYLKDHALPKSIKYYSIIGDASVSRTSIALQPVRLRLVSMGLPNGDGLVPALHAVWPGSSVLGFVNADHWAISMPYDHADPLLAKTFVNKNTFPREVMLSSAMELIAADLAH